MQYTLNSLISGRFGFEEIESDWAAHAGFPRLLQGLKNIFVQMLALHTIPCIRTFSKIIYINMSNIIAFGIKFRCCYSPCGSTVLKKVSKWLKSQNLSSHISITLRRIWEKTKPVIQVLSLPVWVQSQQEAQVQQRETIPSHLEGE